MISSPVVKTFVPKLMLVTTVKLTGSNYLLWAQVFRIFIGKLAHLLQAPPATIDPTYVTWLTGNYFMITWLLNSLEEIISGSVMFLTTAKDMWDTLKVMYENENNSSRVSEIYECLFELKGDRSVLEFYGKVKGLIDELEMHQPFVTNAATLRGYPQDLAVSKFLSGLSLTLQSKVWGQILGGDSIPTLTATFSRVMRVSTGADVFSAPSIEQSVMVSGHGRGHGRAAILEDEDEDLLEVDVARMEADRMPLTKALGNAGIVDAVITSLRSVGSSILKKPVI